MKNFKEIVEKFDAQMRMEEIRTVRFERTSEDYIATYEYKGKELVSYWDENAKCWRCIEDKHLYR